MTGYSIKSNPFDDNGSRAWIVIGEDGSKAWASDEDLERLGTTEEERDGARRGYEIACETMAVETLGDILEAQGY